MDVLRLMTWNVRYFGHQLKGLHATRSGIQRVAGAIASLDGPPDIIALQEVETQSLRAGFRGGDQLSRFVNALHEALGRAGQAVRYTPHYFSAHRYALGPFPPLYTTGLAVLVSDRVQVTESNEQAPDEITCVRIRAAKPLKQRRIVGHLRFRVDGHDTPIDLFNTHLSLPAFLEVGPHRIHRAMGDGSNQVREVEALLSIMEKRSEGTRILVGDFNTRPGSAAYRCMLSHGLTDAFAEVNAYGPVEMSRVSTAGFARARMHIDHVFSSADADWDGLYAAGYDRGTFARLSDHAPKIGSLRLKA